MNGWNPTSWRFFGRWFSFLIGWFLGEPAVNLQGCKNHIFRTSFREIFHPTVTTSIWRKDLCQGDVLSTNLGKTNDHHGDDHPFTMKNPTLRHENPFNILSHQMNLEVCLEITLQNIPKTVGFHTFFQDPRGPREGSGFWDPWICRICATKARAWAQSETSGRTRGVLMRPRRFSPGMTCFVSERCVLQVIKIPWI